MTEELSNAPDRTAERAPRWLIALVGALFFGVFIVLSYFGYTVASQPRYTAQGQAEIDSYRAAVRAAPGDPAALLSLAYAYQQAGRLEEALATYDEVLDLVPIETAALYNKGAILIELGESGKAEEVLWEALEINPGHVLAARTLGEHYAQQGHYRSLLEAVRPAVMLNESSADLQYLTGLAYENLGREEWAKARYRLALQAYPDMPEARAGLERLGAEP